MGKNGGGVMYGKYSLVKVMEKRSKSRSISPERMDVCVIGSRDVIFIDPFLSFQDIVKFMNEHSDSIYMIQDEKKNVLELKEFERLCQIIEHRSVMQSMKN
ncbi:MAG: hypothetical protein VB095_00535 [Anaerovorax sp.]|nr:hypothetical protein [Anaerovorax sp.]